jgi:hypothetical protein
VDTPTESVVDTPTESVVDTPTESVVDMPTETIVDTPTESVVDTPTETVLNAPTETVLDTPTGTVASFDKSVLDDNISTETANTLSVVTAPVNITAGELYFVHAVDMPTGNQTDTNSNVLPSEVDSNVTDNALPVVNLAESIANNTNYVMTSAPKFRTVAVPSAHEDSFDGYSSDTIIVGELEDRDVTMLDESALGCETKNTPCFEPNNITSFEKRLGASCYETKIDFNASGLDFINDANKKNNTASKMPSVSGSKYDSFRDFSDLSCAESEDQFSGFKEIKCTISEVIQSLEDKNGFGSDGLTPLDLSLNRTPSSRTSDGAVSSSASVTANSNNVTKCNLNVDKAKDCSPVIFETGCPLEIVPRGYSKAVAAAESGHSGLIGNIASLQSSANLPTNSGDFQSLVNKPNDISKPKCNTKKTIIEQTADVSDLSNKSDRFENTLIHIPSSAKPPNCHIKTPKSPASELSHNEEYIFQKQIVDRMRESIFGQCGTVPEELQATASPPSHKCSGKSCHVCSVYYQYQLMYMMQINQFYSCGSIPQFDPSFRVLNPNLTVADAVRPCLKPKARKIRKTRRRMSDMSDSAVTVSPWKCKTSQKRGSDEENCAPIVKKCTNVIHENENSNDVVTSRDCFRAPVVIDEKYSAPEMSVISKVTDVNLKIKNDSSKPKLSVPDSSIRNVIHNDCSKKRPLTDDGSFREQPLKRKALETSKEHSTSPELPSVEETLNSLYDGTTAFTAMDSERCFGNVRECPIVSDVATDSVTSSPEISKQAITKANDHSVRTPNGSVVPGASQWAVVKSGGLKLKLCRIVVTPIVTKSDDSSPKSKEATSRSTKRKKPSVDSRTGLPYCMGRKSQKKRKKLQF